MPNSKSSTISLTPDKTKISGNLLAKIKGTEAAKIWSNLPVTDTLELITSAKNYNTLAIFCYYKGDGFVAPMGLLYNLIERPNGSYELHFTNIEGMVGFDDFKITITKNNFTSRIKYIVLSDDNTELIQKLQSQQNNTPPKKGMVSRIFGKRDAKIHGMDGGQKQHKTIRKHKNKRKTVRHKK